MSGKIFEREHIVRFYETGNDQHLHLVALMRYFEELALLQSESNGVGFDYYRKHQVIWMLHRFDIRIHAMPAFGDKILLRTQAVSVYRFMGFRDFLVLGENGEELVTARSAWLFIDTRTKRPLRVNEDMKQAYGHLDYPEHRPDMPDLPQPGRSDTISRFEVRREDIDVNDHVNHVTYIRWALESVPDEIYLKSSLTGVQVAWMKETLPGTGVEVHTEANTTKDASVCIHSIRDKEGQEKCRLLTEWKQRPHEPLIS